MFKKLKKKPLPLTVFALTFVALLLFEIFALNVSSIILILIGGIIGIVAYGILEGRVSK